MPPALQPQPEPVTLEQYEALPEEKRAEVFDGILYDMASPSQIHQALSMELSNIIYNYKKNKKGENDYVYEYEYEYDSRTDQLYV